jgi:outer membrane protein assembly factor BamE
MQRFAVHRPLAAAALLVMGTLMGCSSLQSSDNFLGLITPYRVEVVQGNVVTQEQIALVKPGITRLQVRDALGSPLLTDIFHADRWDYVFTIRRKGVEEQGRHIVLLFDGDVLKSVEAPALPAEREFVAAITAQKNQASSSEKNLELTEEQRKALPAPKPAEAAASAAEPVGPVRTYPPLEKP